MKEIGVEADHVFQLGLGSSDDRTIWEYAHKNSMIVVSKDQDFLSFSLKSTNGPQLIWVRLGNLKTQELIAVFVSKWSELSSVLASGEKVVELG